MYVDGPEEGDAFGAALLDRLGGQGGSIVIERDDGFVEVDQSDYFADPGDEVLWRWVRQHLKGRVLDVGAGAGRAALSLQADGVEVVGLDVSAGAVEVCRRRGVVDTFVGSVGDLAAFGKESFDSFLCFGGNLGLLGSRDAAGDFFAAAAGCATKQARMVGTLIDPYLTDSPVHLAYHAANRAAGRLSGTVRIRVRYKRTTTRWFSLLWVSPDELAAVATDNGWFLTDHFATGGPVYAAELRPVYPAQVSPCPGGVQSRCRARRDP